MTSDLCVMIKESEIVSRNPLKFKKLEPTFLTSSGRWTKDIKKAKLFSYDTASWSIADKWSKRYMYAYRPLTDYAIVEVHQKTI